MINFEEIMAYSKGNSRIYAQLVKFLRVNKIVPFVGAGLSSFAFPMWAGLLREMNATINDDNILNAIEQKISNFEYQDAADMIHQTLGIKGFYRLLRDIESDDKMELAGGINQRKREAVALLPLLFRGTMITTNYDCVIETVYSDNKIFLKTSIPKNQNILDRAIQGQIDNILFKMHGDIDSDKDDIIFTGESYNRHYIDDSELVRRFSSFIENKMLLFLGASLSVDRTTEILKRVIAKANSLNHFAIISCKKEDLDTRAHDISEQLGISAIMYPDNQHEAVRVILERLLKDIDAEEYAKLPFSIDSRLQSTNRFKYDSGIVGFVGRDDEMKKLDEFCQANPSVPLWWAITGEGGLGKSRLVFEFAKKMKDLGWLIVDKQHSWTEFLSMAKNCSDNTLFVIDYVKECASEIGAWLGNLHRRNGHCHWRILFIERDGNCADDADWIELIKKGDKTGTTVNQYSYIKDFLRIKPLGSDEIQKIMADYAKALNEIPNADEMSNLLEQLTIIDEKLVRPLYALFIVDAWHKHREALHWDREQILNYVVDREQQRIRTGVQAAEPNAGERVINACLHIKGLATMLGGLPLESVADFCPEDQLIVESYVKDAKANCRDISGLFCIASMDIEKKDRYENISAIYPDIVGEYFVLKTNLTLSIDTNQARRQKELLLIWRNPYKAAVFFDKIFSDYLNEIDRHKGLLQNILDSAKSSTNIKLNRKWYSTLLFNLSNKQDNAEREETVKRLEELIQEYPDDSAVLEAYAKGLFNLSNKQVLAERETTVKRLEDLIQAYPDNSVVRERLAKGLFNLSIKQELAGRETTVKRLEDLHQTYTDDNVVLERLAKGLFNLSNIQDLVGCESTVERLEDLHQAYPDNNVVRERLAMGLFNLSILQGLAGRETTVKRLEDLHQAFTDDNVVLERLAKVLFNLSNMQELVGCELTVKRLEDLHHAYMDDSVVLERLAMGLFNLSVKQDLVGRETTVKRLENLNQDYPDNSVVRERLARGLFNLSNGRNLTGRAATAERLQDLHQAYPDDRAVRGEFAKGLFNLCTAQNLAECELTVERLEDLHQAYPYDSAVRGELAKGLFNLCNIHDLEGCESTVYRIEDLHQAYPDDSAVRVEFAKGLFNLSIKQDMAGYESSSERLEDLHMAYPDESEIKRLFDEITMNS